MRKTLLMIAATILAGCATQPEEIAAAYTSPVLYANSSCEQLALESHRVAGRTAELRGQLEKKANNDAVQMGVGLVLFWPTLFFLEGGDGAEAAEFARLKGEKEAIDKTLIAKNCQAVVVR